mmetsp:Transcript_10860/g.9774  ORF Transcript_10860/g.9774 Transcript_10860/m.9774 type:complete len:285 (+) Transcript_10860:2-856(+)
MNKLSSINRIKSISSKGNESIKSLNESKTQDTVTITYELVEKVADSAYEHILELENEINQLKLQLNELNNSTLKEYQLKIIDLENELIILREKEREAININTLISLSAKQHIEELLNDLILKTKENEKLLAENNQLKSLNNNISSNSNSSSNSRKNTSSSRANDLSPIRSSPLRESTLPRMMSRLSSSNFNQLQLDLSKIVKEGYLLKKSPSMFKSWQSRYFVLLDSLVLAYYDKEQDFRTKKSANGLIVLNDIPFDQIYNCIIMNLHKNGIMLSLDCVTRLKK